MGTTESQILLVVLGFLESSHVISRLVSLKKLRDDAKKLVSEGRAIQWLK